MKKQFKESSPTENTSILCEPIHDYKGTPFVINQDSLEVSNEDLSGKNAKQKIRQVIDSIEKAKMPELRVVSLFSGCGGMDLGFEGDFNVYHRSINTKINPKWNEDNSDSKWLTLPRTNFKVVFANDILREAKAAWIPYFHKRGADGVFRSESIVELVKKSEQGEKIFPAADVVTGGFPCQDFSVAGKRLGFDSHKLHNGEFRDSSVPSIETRGQLYMWMRRVVEIVNPKMFIAENVKGLVSLGNVKQIIENDFRNIGQGFIVLDARVLKAWEYGVPQSRERVFFIGLNKQYLKPEVSKIFESGRIPPELDPYPIPTHTADSSLLNENRDIFVSLREVFADLEEPEKSEDPAQQNLSRAKWYGKGIQGQTEVNLDWVGPTIRAEHHGNIEFRRLGSDKHGRYLNELAVGKVERRLTIRECARIQTFPDDFEFIRNVDSLGKEFSLSQSAAYKVIGNAVPPLLAYHIANRLQDVWPRYFGETHDYK